MKPIITTSAAVQSAQNNLTDEESKVLIECESVIDKGKKTFIDVANAILKIKDGALYRRTHQTFDLYLRDRFGFTHQYASVLLKSAAAAEKAQPLVAVRTQSVAHQLSKFDPPSQENIVKEVARTDKELTQENLARAAKVVHAKPSKPKVHVTVEPPKPSPSKPEKEHLSKIAALEAQLETLQRGSMFANKIRSDIANLKAAVANVSEAEIVALPESPDPYEDDDPALPHVKSNKAALLAELAEVEKEWLHPNCSHPAATVRPLIARFVKLINKHL